MTATPVPPPDPSPLLPPEEKFWHRHSPHQEFPLSGVATVLIHLLVLFVIVLIAGVRGCTVERSEPLPIVGIEVGGNNIPDAPPGRLGDDRPKVEIQRPGLPELPGGPLQPLPRPTVKSPVEPVDVPRLEQPRDSGTADDFRDRIDRALKSGGTPGQGPKTGGGGGPRGDIGNERSQRMSRWTLEFNYSGPEEYVRQLHLLGAQIGFPRPGDEGRVDLIQDLSRRPASLELTEPTKINRIFWSDVKPASVQGVCQVLGVSLSPPYFYAFFPIKLEEEMARMELAVGRRHGRNRVEDIQSTVFAVTFIGQRPVVEVIEQTGTDGRRTVLGPRPR